jgi:hypothetical protein
VMRAAIGLVPGQPTASVRCPTGSDAGRTLISMS